MRSGRRHWEKTNFFHIWPRTWSSGLNSALPGVWYLTDWRQNPQVGTLPHNTISQSTLRREQHENGQLRGSLLPQASHCSLVDVVAGVLQTQGQCLSVCGWRCEHERHLQPQWCGQDSVYTPHQARVRV